MCCFQSQRLLFMLIALIICLHSVCSLLQPQPAALAHSAFSNFLDQFLNVEPDGDSSKLADKMVGAMAGHYGNVPKVKKSSGQVESDCMLGMTGEHVRSFDPTAAPTTL